MRNARNWTRLPVGLLAVAIGIAVGVVRYGKLTGRAEGGDVQAGCGGAAVDESHVGSVQQGITAASSASISFPGPLARGSYTSSGYVLSASYTWYRASTSGGQDQATIQT